MFHHDDFSAGEEGRGEQRFAQGVYLFSIPLHMKKVEIPLIRGEEGVNELLHRVGYQILLVSVDEIAGSDPPPSDISEGLLECSVHGGRPDRS